MNYLKIKSLLLCAAVLTSATMVKAQNDDRMPVKEMIDTKNFVFKAQMMSPLSGRIINLTGGYDLTIRPDSIIAYLPYFGRVYSAPVIPADGGIKFTTEKFDYKTTKRKKNRWEIAIKTNDVSDGYQLYLTVFDNGRTSLRVSSVNRQAVVFDGYVVEGAPLNKKGF